MNKPNVSMGDKDYLGDGLIAQKHITASYNTYANECVNPQLKTEFLNILDEEHQIGSELFNQLSAKGWYQVTPAEEQKVTQARQKFVKQV